MTMRSRRFSGWRAKRGSSRRWSRRTRSRTPFGSRRGSGLSEVVLVNLSGRGDKDVMSVQKRLAGAAARREKAEAR